MQVGNIYIPPFTLDTLSSARLKTCTVGGRRGGGGGGTGEGVGEGGAL